MNNKIKFLRGTSGEYTAAKKDNDTIYFTTDKSVTYYDGTTSTVVIPTTVSAISDSTPDTDLANVKAIKDFVAA